MIKLTAKQPGKYFMYIQGDTLIWDLYEFKVFSYHMHNFLYILFLLQFWFLPITPELHPHLVLQHLLEPDLLVVA